MSAVFADARNALAVVGALCVVSALAVVLTALIAGRGRPAGQRRREASVIPFRPSGAHNRTER